MSECMGRESTSLHNSEVIGKSLSLYPRICMLPAYGVVQGNKSLRYACSGKKSRRAFLLPFFTLIVYWWKNMGGIWNPFRNNNLITAWKWLIIKICSSSPGLIETVKIFKLHAQDCSLDGIQPWINADITVMIPLFHSMVGYASNLFARTSSSVKIAPPSP